MDGMGSIISTWDFRAFPKFGTKVNRELLAWICIHNKMPGKSIKLYSPKWWLKIMVMNPMGSNPSKNHQLNKSKQGS